jgi:ribokinase
MKFDIVTFGSGLTDIFAYTDVHEKHHMLEYPIGSKIQIKKLAFDIGGGGVNTSTTFALMGLKTAFWGTLSKDPFGKKILDAVKKNKITYLGTISKEGGYSIILDSKEHDRTILTYKGSNDLLEMSEKEIKNLKTEWIYFSSLIGKGFQTYKKIAKNLPKVKIAFNPSAYLIKKENAKELIKYCKILILNKEEADMLEKDHARLLNLGPEIICVTDGKRPFNCYTKDKTFKAYPHEEIKTIEKTGAGDAFASGFVAAYIKTNDIKTSLQIGVANSESVVQYFGARNKILTWNEALKTIKNNPCKIIVQ